MLESVEVREENGSVVVTLPQDMADHYRLNGAGVVYAVETPDGILLTASNTTYADAMSLARRGAARSQTAIRVLSPPVP